uniref:Uncharacterized protein n=1 Tax=Chromera velia CCMP2878 TaxID=1169474 RepID=A0A0G4G6T4_9ALVE|mmetsp:Transcript_9891/g.19179  ORF Transcript_9891/g.19179 Transcript_9891/m.19179 type:complete len:319 (+) Transcript_9891:313-1269(+)|eukprot:Cvel_4254.t1-p1 / transcript=Cvel_4254.t1 / gene=Cvel_4254 / organism=Chromera_velia_CCMP2878 / gene_product=hypothetical protein / transcript_product=hypothetical protein / location=Cvel_scaffold184:42332-46684(+) / protein_length=318 / sequence_SO=supercontig / SO=protein_coding / is_pseudo=false
MKRSAPEEVAEALGKLVKFDAEAVVSSCPSVQEIKRAEELLRSARQNASVQGKDAALESLLDHVYSVFDVTEEDIKKTSLRKILWTLKVHSVDDQTTLTKEENEGLDPVGFSKLAKEEPAGDFRVVFELFGVTFTMTGAVRREPQIIRGGIPHARGWMGVYNFEPFAFVKLEPSGVVKVDAESNYMHLMTYAEKWASISEFDQEDPNAWIIASRLIVVALCKLLRQKYRETHGRELNEENPALHLVMYKFESHMFEWEPDREAASEDEEDEDEDEEDEEEEDDDGDEDGDEGGEEDDGEGDEGEEDEEGEEGDSEDAE